MHWNNYHRRTFISSSADWTGNFYIIYMKLFKFQVKIWDSKYPTPIMSFDLGMTVVDAVWSPYSSTGKFINQSFKSLFLIIIK